MSEQPYSGPEVEAAVRILKDDAQLAHNRALAERMERIEQRLGRMPVTEMTLEEKAKAWDDAQKAQQSAGNAEGVTKRAPEPDGPVPPAPKPPEPPKVRHDKWWGDQLS